MTEYSSQSVESWDKVGKTEFKNEKTRRKRHEVTKPRRTRFQQAVTAREEKKKKREKLENNTDKQKRDDKS